MLAKIILNSIFKNKIQKFLAFLTCFLATLLLCIMLNITLSIGNEVTEQLKSYGSNILVLPKGSNLNIEIGNEIYEPLKNKNYLEEKNLYMIKDIYWRNNITALAPFLDGKIIIKNNNKTMKTLLYGTYFSKAIKIKDDDDFVTGIQTLYPYLKVEGNWAKDDSNEIMLGEDLAKNSKFKIGENITLIGENNISKEVKIVGILLHTNPKMSNKIIAPLHLAQELLDKQGLYSSAEVRAFTIPESALSEKVRRLGEEKLDQVEYDKWYCSAYVGSIASQIKDGLPGSDVKVLNAISDAQNLIVKKIQSLMSITCIICIIISSIAISSLMNSEIHRRKREIGLLKVLGADTFQIYLIFSSENLIVAFIAAIFGFIFGIGISEIISLNIFGYFIDIAFIALPLSLVFAGLIAIIGCLIPIRHISNLSPVEVLYGK
ncbi:ABC transporter permease [Campylobacter sp. RM10532]|uniref:ABC transporter permease n=1 Tax=Campylobacter TaxID=194 RepID=UPI001904C441|nr:MULTISPECIES: ABC transporter permease [unclassified Campylobacter]MBZ7929675.1 ABC transporter permease [Campylobacter sp. W0067]MBZ7932311.1 ABC transporter permease [Campylobacter sp. RM10543]MBZ7936850.1 ABC transporter permease [Campylobacter sp. RM10538]MBZ7943583.1 ABC transporter permease [Campylobacter sp. RM13744]MBZ7944866.1 ABC transporter permease [Campylobacter sp. RM10532]MBZ7947695.1 ABC transporter permease [Campylobacter sp. RM9929]MBZ7948951.1 ABC transporter permease [